MATRTRDKQNENDEPEVTSKRRTQDVEEEAQSEPEFESRRVAGPNKQDLLWEWQALMRPYRQLNKEVFTTILAGAFLLGVILFVIDGIIPVMLVVSILFFWYVSGTVRPYLTRHRITTWGIETEEKLWLWEYMTRYWFEGSGDTRQVVIEMVTWWPRHLRLVIDTQETEEVVDEILSEFLVKDQPKPNWLDKASRWLEGRIRWSAA